MILLVAEKPSVANQHYKPMLERLEGEKFTQGDGCLIGQKHCITWCVGHLITLAPLDAYPGYEGNWQLKNLPLLPEKFRLAAIDSTRKQLGVVRSMMEKADVLVNGADAGREGNLIFDLILDFTPDFKKKQIKRLWVNSYVAKDLDKAWKNLEDATQRINLSYAARLRQRADWMVGLNATRAYTLTAGRGKMISVGRVQTPTLNLIVERDSIVEQFKELFYYSVVGTWKGYQSQLVRLGTDKENANFKVVVFEKDAEPQGIINKCKAPSEATISKIETQQKKQFPQKPFDLTELQKEGNKRFKFSAQQVLDCAQNLYEKKLLTYPRTDSQYLPDTMKQEAYQLASKLSTPEQKNFIRDFSENFVFINSSKVTDHFAIIPTGEPATNLPEPEQKIYELVLDRFVNAWLKPYVWNEMEVLLTCPQSNAQPETFRLKLKQNQDLGFRLIVKEDKKKKPKKSENDEKGETADNTDNADNSDEITNIVENFPNWKQGDSAPFDNLDLQKKKKSKPKYYTEATLLAAMKTAGKQIENEELAEAMKDRGLGTPATQAGIIETLKKRGFIEAQKNYLVSTARGRNVISLMDEKIKSPEMTGEWEYQLAQVEKGNLEPSKFRDGIVDYVKQLFTELHSKYQNQFERETVTETIACPKCSSPLEIAPWGYICKNEACDLKFGHTIAGRTLSHSEMTELLTAKATPILNGFKSKKGTLFNAKLSLDENYNISFIFESDGKFHGAPTEYTCPICKGHLEENKNTLFCNGKKDSTDCKFTLFKTIAGHTLTTNEIHDLFCNGTTAQITDFKSKKGDTFAARLKLNANGQTTFEFTRKNMPCPCCGDQLRFREGNNANGDNLSAYICVNSQCNYGIPQVFYQHTFSDDEIEELLVNRCSKVIGPFKKNTTTFKSALEIQEGGKIAFNKLTVEVISD